MKEEFVKIGETKKPHGLNGELKLFLEEKYEEDFERAEVIFLEIGGNHTPFFVENLRGGGFPILKLEDINSRDDALSISKKRMFLRASDLIPDEERTAVEETLVFEKLVGYQIHDMETGPVGEIKSLLEMPQQEMAVVSYKNKEIFIPIHEKLIEEVIDSERIVKMNLPDGLLDF